MSHEEQTHSIPFEVTDVRWANNAIRLDPGFTQQLFFHNGLSTPVTVVYRNGIAITISPTNDHRTPRNFIIRSVWSANRSVIVDQQYLSNDLTDDWNDECSIIKEAIVDSTSSCGPGRKGGIDYALKLADFKNNQNSLYLHQHDLLVSIAAKDAVPLHPYSDRGMRGLMLSNDAGIMGTEQFQYGITIVDKQNRFGRKFVNIGGEVFSIQPIQDTELNDGVYFKTSGPVSEVGLVAKPRCVYLSFEQAKEKLGLHNSVEEAATLGNPKTIEDRATRELAMEGKRMEHDMRMRAKEREEELEDIRHRQALRDALQHDLEAQMKDERSIQEHRRAMESLSRKDWYEERTLERKNTGDMIKYVPALVAAIGSVVVLMSKR